MTPPLPSRRARWASQRGQALLELAIFGSLLLVAIGTLLNYGLSAGFNQQVLMESFRKALGLASSRGSATVAVIRDNPIPNPSNPFALGAVLPTGGSASVIQDFQLADRGSGPSRILFDFDNTINVGTTTSSDGAIQEYTVANGSDVCAGQILSRELLEAECRVNGSLPCCDQLTTLFNGIQTLGVQPGRVTDSASATALARAETPGEIQTSEVVRWRADVTRHVLTRSQDPDNTPLMIDQTVVTTPQNQLTTRVSTTPWDENDAQQ